MGRYFNIGVRRRILSHSAYGVDRLRRSIRQYLLRRGLGGLGDGGLLPLAYFRFRWALRFNGLGSWRFGGWLWVMVLGDFGLSRSLLRLRRFLHGVVLTHARLRRFFAFFPLHGGSQVVVLVGRLIGLGVGGLWGRFRRPLAIASMVRSVRPRFLQRLPTLLAHLFAAWAIVLGQCRGC